jgi:AcrR family transcriptional regulator
MGTAAVKTISPGKREQQKEARRVAIIDAALEEFTAQGYTATKLDDVAVRAGIGKGTIYLYFDSKESLFEEVVRRTLFPGRDMAKKHFAEFEGSASDQLAYHFRNMYAYMQNEKVAALCAMVMGEAVRFPALSRFFYNEVISHTKPIFRGVISKGVRSGEFKPDAEKVYNQMLISPVMIGCFWNLQFGEMETINMQDYAEVHIDFMLRALRA